MAVQSSIKSREALSRLAETWRKAGIRLALTSGVFDLLHLGHITFLKAIKEQTQAAKLIVAVNSDASVRTLKGAFRPVVPAEERAALISALSCVDGVFIFSETNNKENVLALRPDYYVKASDYDVKTLSSAKYLKAWNGSAVTIPMIKGYSTSQLLEQIVAEAFKTGFMPKALETGYPDKAPDGTPLPLKRAVFLDRDGVIVTECEYLHKSEDVKLLPGVEEALKRLNALGYPLIIITNQPGIGMGYFSREDFFRVNKEMLRLLSRAGVMISGIYLCPHTQAVGCSCRKPEGALITQAALDHHLNVKQSFFIGDQTSDIEAARRLEMTAILVATGQGGSDQKYQATPHFKAQDCLAAAEWIASHT